MKYASFLLNFIADASLSLNREMCQAVLGIYEQVLESILIQGKLNLLDESKSLNDTYCMENHPLFVTFVDSNDGVMEHARRKIQKRPKSWYSNTEATLKQFCLPAVKRSK